MARSGPSTRKIIEFDAETWTALRLLSQDGWKSLQELVVEAVRDLLVKHNRPRGNEAAVGNHRDEISVLDRI